MCVYVYIFTTYKVFAYLCICDICMYTSSCMCVWNQSSTFYVFFTYSLLEFFETALSQWIQSALNWLNWLVNKPRDSSIESFPALALQVSCWDIIFFSLNECWQPKLMSLYLGSKHCTDWVTFLVFIHAMCYVLIFYSNTLIIIYFLALKEL